MPLKAPAASLLTRAWFEIVIEGDPIPPSVPRIRPLPRETGWRLPWARTGPRCSSRSRDRPTAGSITFDGRETTSLADAELASFRNREIGFVWQTHYLLPEFTALENVMMPLLIRGSSLAEAAPPALARLEETGLKARASHRAGELSGGEQQRVVLARALVGNPKFLLADEPTGNLDHRTGEMIIALLTELHRSHGLTSVYVTHNLSFARRCDRVLRLEAGALAPEGLRSGAPDADAVSVQSGKSYV